MDVHEQLEAVLRDHRPDLGSAPSVRLMCDALANTVGSNREALRALGWDLTPQQMAELERAYAVGIQHVSEILDSRGFLWVSPSGSPELPRIIGRAAHGEGRDGE